MDKKIVNRNKLIRRQKIFLVRRLVFIFLIFVIFVLVLINSPIFNVKGIKVVGNNLLSTEYITQELNGVFHKNILFHSMEQEFSSLRQNKYVESVTYKRKYPNKLEVIVTEKKIDYYIYYNNEYYIFDRESRLIDTLDYKDDFDILEIIGVDFKGNLNIGDSLFEQDSRQVQWLKSISELLDLNKSNIKFDYINLSDVHNVIIGYNDIEIRIGSNSDLRQKLNIAINTLNSNESYSKMSGYIDVRSKNYPVISLH